MVDDMAKPWRRSDHPDILLALDLFVGTVGMEDGTSLKGQVRAISRYLGVSHTIVQRWVARAWWNVIEGVKPTDSNEVVNQGYWKQIAAEGHTERLDTAYRQFQAQRGIILDPQPTEGS
jgi:hypothetical protein